MGRSTDRVTAADIIEFVHTFCFVPEGPLVGQPLRLLPWQQDWIRSVYDNPHGTRRAILSMPRKNGKTGSDRLPGARACLRSAGAPSAEFADFQRGAIPRPGRSGLPFGFQDGAHEPAS